MKEEELVALNDIKDFHQKMKKSEAPIWEMFTPRKVYSFTRNSPEIGMLSPYKDGMNMVLGQTMSIINQEARKVRSLQFLIQFQCNILCENQYSNYFVVKLDFKNFFS